MFDKNEKEIKKIDKSMEQLDASIHENICRIGYLFYNANKEKQDVDGGYQDLMDTIRKLEAEKKELYRERLKRQGLMQCEYCGSIISYGSVFCNKCGMKLEKEDPPVRTAVCPFCGEPNEEGSDFCAGCGKRLNEGKEGE